MTEIVLNDEFLSYHIHVCECNEITEQEEDVF